MKIAILMSTYNGEKYLDEQLESIFKNFAENLDINDIEITNDVNVDVKVDWLSNVIDCPITDLSSTLKYILGAIILGSGTYLVYRNVKKSKNNI